MAPSIYLLQIFFIQAKSLNSVAVTAYSAPDISMMDDLLNIEEPSDGAYYGIIGVQNLGEKGLKPVIPPPSNAIIHGKNNTIWHDKIVKYIQKKETVYAFYKKYSYGLQALVEAQSSRIKRYIETF